MTAGERDKEQWYAMRVYKNEMQAESMLSAAGGLNYFIPKRYALRTFHGKKKLVLVPVIPSLVFVYASFRQIIAFKQDKYNSLQFIPRSRDIAGQYLTVRDKDMVNFIKICEQYNENTCFYKPEDINIEKGTKVRVHGGPLDNVEGVFIKVAGKRSRQLVVLLTGVMAVATTVEPEYLEIIM